MLNLISRLSIPQLHSILCLDEEDIKTVNAILRKKKDDDFFDIMSQKKYLIEVTKNSIDISDLERPEVMTALVNALTTKDVELLKTKYSTEKFISIDKTRTYFKERTEYSNRFLLFLAGAIESIDIEPELVGSFIQSDQDLLAPPKPFPSLQGYQLGLYTKLIDILNNPRSKAMLCMPTGTGKTRTSMEVVLNYINNAKNVLWLVDSQELMTQAALSFIEVHSHIGRTGVHLSQVGYSYKGKFNSDVPNFQIYSIQTLHRYSDDQLKKIAKQIDLIVFDEAHHLEAPKTKQVIEKLTPIAEETRVLGLSATPFRTDSSESASLREYFNNCIVKLETLDPKLSLVESLVQKKILAKPLWKKIEYKKQFVLTTADLTYLSKNRELSKDILQKIAKDFDRNLQIFNVITEQAKKNKSVIFFSTTREQSKEISVALNCSGIKAAHLDCDSPNSFRKGAIDSFKTGKINVLCNYGILTTGFDAPRINSVVLARVSGSNILINQMIGRGLRGPLLGGTETCEVYVPNDSIPSVIATVEDVENLLNEWDSNLIIN